MTEQNGDQNIEVDLELLRSRASPPMLAALPGLSDEAIKSIAAYVRFVDEREEREKQRED